MATFCPVCGSTVYDADPALLPAMISGFEEYRFPWALNVAVLPMPGGHRD